MGILEIPFKCLTWNIEPKLEHHQTWMKLAYNNSFEFSFMKNDQQSKLTYFIYEGFLGCSNLSRVFRLGNFTVYCKTLNDSNESEMNQGEFVGGLDIVKELKQEGDLIPTLKGEC